MSASLLARPFDFDPFVKDLQRRDWLYGCAATLSINIKSKILLNEGLELLRVALESASNQPQDDGYPSDNDVALAMKAGEIIKEKMKLNKSVIEDWNKKMRSLKTDLAKATDKLFGPSNVEKEKAAAAAQKQHYVPGQPKQTEEPKYAIQI